MTAARPLRIETPRLVLYPLAREHETGFHAINTDPAVRRFLFDGNSVSAADSAEMLSRSLALLDREGHGLFGVSLRGDDALAGWAGYLHSHHPPVLEVAYALLPRYWGRGFAVEAMRGVMTWGVRCLGLKALRASTDAPNTASIRVLEKLGFVESKRTGCSGAELIHFVIDAAKVDQSDVVCVRAA